MIKHRKFGDGIHTQLGSDDVIQVICVNFYSLGLFQGAHRTLWTIWRAIAGKVTGLGPGLQSSTIGGESERGLVRRFEEQGRGDGIPTYVGAWCHGLPCCCSAWQNPSSSILVSIEDDNPLQFLKCSCSGFSPFSAWAHIAQYIAHSNVKEFLHLFASNSCYSWFCIIAVFVALLWPSTICDRRHTLVENLPSPLLVSTLPLQHSSCYLQESPTAIFLGTLCCHEGFLGHHGYTKDRHAFLKTAETTTCCHFLPYGC